MEIGVREAKEAASVQESRFSSCQLILWMLPEEEAFSQPQQTASSCSDVVKELHRWAEGVG